MSRVGRGWFPRQVALLALLSCAAPALADRLFVSSFNLGDISEIDMVTGAVTLIDHQPRYYEDGACDPLGEFVYFAAGVNDVIDRWPVAGGARENVVPAAGPIWDAEGLVFDDAGDLYMNTRANPHSADGAWRVAGGSPTGIVSQVVPHFSDFGEGATIVAGGPHAGALLLVDTIGGPVFMSEPPGNPVTSLVPDSAFPTGAYVVGVATDCGGNVYVSYIGAGSGVKKFDPDGAFLSDFVPGGSFLIQPFFMEFDSTGALWVADQLANAVFRVASDGTGTLVASVPAPVGLAICRDIPCSTVTCDAGPPAALDCAALAESPGMPLDGTGSSSPATYAWSTGCPGGTFDDPTSAQPTLFIADAPCELTCTASLTVTDSSGGSASCSTLVTIAQPPPVPGPAVETRIWPPNHGYVVFDAASIAGDSPSCAGSTWSATSCASSQPEDARETSARDDGNGDGHTVEDCVISADGLSFAARAERLGSCGKASARVYTVGLALTDACGRSAPSSARIVVEHDRSEHEDVLFGLSLPPNEPPPFPYVHATTYGVACPRAPRTR